MSVVLSKGHHHFGYAKLELVTSLLILLPTVVGLLLWGSLPDQIATHFGTNNEADGWSSKPMAVIGLPVFMLAIQWLVFFLTSYDPKKKNINPKIFKVVLWLIPIISIIVYLSTYMSALGYGVNIGLLVNLLVGVVFIVLGNYLHKVKQNYTIGIRIPWTLNSKENWNRTNRLASWLFIISGLLFILNAFLLQGWLLIIPIVAVVLVPFAYSFMMFKKGV
ncbi:hemolysin expression modulating protein [Tetragenococcus osmophilus]|uniref:Hemolysin expression modulating protein n=1 Tax=Tetragenococcus osmophilus TaxID=526944 RepID=A0ABM7ABJ4_9ENTE|nr:hemolysin expression modulating protein [Tetragenococcus osmophilus]